MSGPAQDAAMKAGMQTGNAVAEFWKAAGDAALQAQQDAARAFASYFKPSPASSEPAAPEKASSDGIDTPALARASQAMSDLLLSASALHEKLLNAGMAAAGSGTAYFETGFRAMTEPNAWLTGVMGFEALQGPAAYLAEGPKFADLWTLERQQARVLKAWLDMCRCRLEHGAIVLGAWQRAGQVFLNDLSARTRADGQPPAGQALLALWTETANRELLETQRSEAFLRTQAALMRTSTELKLAQREVVEAWANQFGLPTRTELDDVHRTVTDLRRELRVLQRQQRELASAAAAVAEQAAMPEPASATRRRGTVGRTSRPLPPHSLPPHSPPQRGSHGK
jgi:hypothetical protein